MKTGANRDEGHRVDLVPENQLCLRCNNNRRRTCEGAELMSEECVTGRYGVVMVTRTIEERWVVYDGTEHPRRPSNAEAVWG